MKTQARVDEGRTLNPGLLRHQIQWQRKGVSGLDSYGQDTFAWGAVVACRCQIKELEGRELEFVMQRWGEAKFQITQHYTPGLEVSDRGAWLVDGAYRYLDLIAVTDPPGTGRYQVIYAKEWKG